MVMRIAILGAKAEKSDRGRQTGGQPDEGVRLELKAMTKLYYHLQFYHFTNFI